MLGILKAQNYATALAVLVTRIDDDFEIMHVKVDVTETGFAFLADIIELIYHSIGQSIDGGINEDVYNQIKAEDRLSFESFELSNPADHCAVLAMNANTMDLEHAIVGDNII